MASSSSFTSFLIVLSISCSIFYSASGARVLSAPTTNTEFIRTSCRVTTYPKLCLTSLASQTTAIQTSPKLMASAALTVTLSSAKSTSSMMQSLFHSHGLKPREVAAMRDCVEVLRDSVDEIQRSISEMGNFKSSDFGMMISDVQTWVSAALTDENTCTDGFAGNGLNGNLKTVVRGKIVNIAQLTSNALALVNRYASLHG